MFIATSFMQDPLTIFVIGLTLLVLFFWYFATDVDRRKRNIGSVLMIGVTALCLTAALPPREKLKGAIDIVGGSSFTLRVQEREDDNGNKMPVTKEQVEQAIIIISKRLDAMGGKESMIVAQGSDSILVQMPGATPEEGEQIEKILKKVAKLELRQVSPRSNEPGADGKPLAKRVLERSEIVPGFQAFEYKQKDRDGNETKEPILLSRRAALTGSDIALASPSSQQPDAVDIVLNGDGEDKMINLTKDMTPRVDRIAIVLDGEVISAPVVNSVPLGKSFYVEGLREPGEVQTLANALMNPLDNPLEIGTMQRISPTLGAAVVEQGVLAGILSLAATFLFVLIYYRISGFIAIIGLCVNTVILFGIMAMMSFTFSLPGIAGMILTIGMAVDANVLIYERLREELEHGKSLRNALEASYDRAFSAIFDSHVTSLITAVILFILGSSTIKGFAVTLTIGVTASLFSAILVTRVLFRWGFDLNLLKKLKFLNLIKSHNHDFMGKRRLAVTLALVTVLIAVAAVAVRRDKAMGVDFTGGTMITFQLGKDKHVSLEDTNKALDSMKLSKEAYPQIQNSPATGDLLLVRCATPDSESIIAKLRETLPILGEKKPGSETSYVIAPSLDVVEPLIGGTFLKQSLLAVALGLLGIVLYMTMRFEFSFALGGFVAIFHDIIICIGLVVLMGREISLIHVGAVLTVAGYSISDTIVVFDRIRELLLVNEHKPVEKIMNEAVNSTLSRTILTSGATLVSVAFLGILGGPALRDFGLVIFIGIIVGTFSSIYIASPVVLWWSGRKGGDLRRDVIASKEKEEAVIAAP
jgi:SecD/SecF fusion protein